MTPLTSREQAPRWGENDSFWTLNPKPSRHIKLSLLSSASILVCFMRFVSTSVFDELSLLPVMFAAFFQRHAVIGAYALLLVHAIPCSFHIFHF